MIVEKKRICGKCIKEDFLSKEIFSKGRSGKCSYCKRKLRCYPLVTVAERVARVIETHFSLTPAEPDDLEYAMMRDRESDYEWYRKGTQVEDLIQEIAQVELDAAADILIFLSNVYEGYNTNAYGEDVGEGPYDDTAHYEGNSIAGGSLDGQWRNFENSIRTKNRFFGLEPLLKEVFNGILEHKSNGVSVVKSVGPTEKIKDVFRARVARSDEEIERILGQPVVELGPPSWLISGNGRLNAKGISVFYGAFLENVAISEVRPPVGARVVTGRFRFIKNLRLLDIEALREIDVKGSYFDPSFKDRRSKAKFLQSLSHRFSQPVMPDDQPFEYLVTQVIADYLASSNDYNLDGLIYPSVWGGGKANIVLFNKASKVEALPKVDGNRQVNTGYFTDEGFESDYSVYEYRLNSEDNESSESIYTMIAPDELKEASLQLDCSSLKIHSVNKVVIESSSERVRWHRFDKKEDVQF